MIELFIIISGLILGSIIGSFLNVVALRFNTGKSLGGRSECFSCGQTLRWYELIPIFSWVFQKGRCRNCSSKISPHYVLGEVISGVFFALIVGRGIFGKIDWFSFDYLVSSLFLFVIFSLLLVILFYDIRHKIIPDELSLAFGVLSFIGMFFFSFEENIFTFVGPHIPELLNILSGILVPLPFVLLWFLSKGKWIGLGDPKLMVGMGFLLGIQKGISAVIVSFWIGTLFIFGALILEKIFGTKALFAHNKKSIMKQEIPFAPFLILGTLGTLVFCFNLFTL